MRPRAACHYILPTVEWKVWSRSRWPVARIAPAPVDPATTSTSLWWLDQCTLFYTKHCLTFPCFIVKTA